MSFLLTNQRISSRNHTALDPGQFACWTHCRRIWWEEGWTGRLWKPRLVPPLFFFSSKKQANLKNRCTPSHWVVHVFVSLGHVMVLALDTSRASLMPTFGLETGQQVFVLPGFAAGELISCVVGRSEKFNTMRWYDTQYIALLLLLICNMVFLWSVESCAPHQQEHTTTPSIQKGSALNQQGMSKAECLEFLGIWKLVISWAVVEWDHVLKYPVFLMAVTRKLGSTQAVVASWAWWALSWRLRFVQKAIALALTRDGSSGGMVRTLVITKDKADGDQNHHGDANKKVWALFFLL